MSNINNLRIGACTVTFGGVSIGHTKGGVKFDYTPKYTELNVDLYGESSVDKVLTSEEITITCKFAEPQVDALNVAIPAGQNVVGSASERLGLGTDAGYSLRSDAAVLVLHPAGKSAADLSEDITIYKAVSTDKIELNYEVNNQRIFEVKFTALIDETYGNGRRLGHIGSTVVS